MKEQVLEMRIFLASSGIQLRSRLEYYAPTPNWSWVIQKWGVRVPNDDQNQSHYTQVELSDPKVYEPNRPAKDLPPFVSRTKPPTTDKKQ